MRNTLVAISHKSEIFKECIGDYRNSKERYNYGATTNQSNLEWPYIVPLINF